MFLKKQKNFNKKIISGENIEFKPSKISNKIHINNKQHNIEKDLYLLLKLILEKKRRRPRNKKQL